MKFNWKKGIGFGLLLWIIMFVIISLFVGFKVSLTSTFMSLLMTLISAIIVLVLAGYVTPKNAGIALGYGLLWAVIGIILDLIISKRFAPGMFREVYYWLSYLLVVILPLLRVKKMAPVPPENQQQ